jgi:hypothetical protein
MAGSLAASPRLGTSCDCSSITRTGTESISGATSAPGLAAVYAIASVAAQTPASRTRIAINFGGMAPSGRCSATGNRRSEAGGGPAGT